MIVTHRGHLLHNKFYGSGEAVVLLHGFLESSAIWDDFIPELKMHNRIICPDLYGHGQTPGSADLYTMEDMADAVAAVMDVANIKSAALVGHSMGGYVTLAFLEKYPERVRAVLLLNSSAYADADVRLKERDQVIKIVRKHKDIVVRSGIKRLFAEENRPRFQEKINRLTATALEMEAESIIAVTRGMKIRKDRTAVLRRFEGKKWILAGQEDALIPVTQLRSLVEQTESRFFEFPGGHMSYIEQYEPVKSVLKAFLL